jgi:Undecaprenyl-phosphate glucose phosphotransferase
VATDTALLPSARAALRAGLERRRAAGYTLPRAVGAGASELGRHVALTIISHRELGYRVVGFLDDTVTGEVTAGLPVLGRLNEAALVARDHALDQIYVALPLEDHAKIVGLIKSLGSECLDVKVVPDLVQYATIRAALEDLDGIPIISLNEVPLRGFNSMVKRGMDVAAGSLLLTLLCTVFPILPAIALAIRLRGGKGPILLRQERMTLDGKTFQIFKFRTMVDGAEKITGPIFATADDPRRTPIGAWLRRYNLDELPQLLNVVLGDMSLVGPRPERPPFVAQFKERIPQYMQRHRVKSGITGWAQVNGWRGNTSIEKRIEYDLYYIQHWSLGLDLKIMWMTLWRGFVNEHAY